MSDYPNEIMQLCKQSNKHIEPQAGKQYKVHTPVETGYCHQNTPPLIITLASEKLSEVSLDEANKLIRGAAKESENSVQTDLPVTYFHDEFTELFKTFDQQSKTLQESIDTFSTYSKSKGETDFKKPGNANQNLELLKSTQPAKYLHLLTREFTQKLSEHPCQEKALMQNAEDLQFTVQKMQKELSLLDIELSRFTQKAAAEKTNNPAQDIDPDLLFVFERTLNLKTGSSES